MQDAELLQFLWLLVIEYVTRLKNHSLLKKLDGIIPFEKRDDKRFDLSFLRIWGFIVYYHISKEKRVKSEKFVSKDKKRYLVKYDIKSESTKTVKIWVFGSRKVIIKQDVDIVEISNKYNSEDPTINYNNENDPFIWNFIDPLKPDGPTN